MTISHIVSAWHRAVNARDTDELANVVAGNVLLSGPRGQTTGRDEVIEWVTRSGITLQTRHRHEISPTEMVVEELATWPGSDSAQIVFTRYRCDGQQLVSIARFGTLAESFNP